MACIVTPRRRGLDLGAILVACAQVGSSRQTFEVTYANARTGTQLRVRSPINVYLWGFPFSLVTFGA